MDIAEKTLRLKTDFDEVYEAGKKAEYAAFWDAFQDNGSRDNYNYAFSYWGNMEFIRPKHKVIPTYTNGCYSIFLSNKAVKRIEAQYFDFSQKQAGTALATGYAYAFSSCPNLEVIEDIKMIPQINYDSAFSYCPNLHTIAKIGIAENTTFNRAFLNCYALQNLTIEGIIGQNGFDIHWSTKLSADSLKSIINALSTTTTELTVTLPTTAQSNYEAVYGEGSWATLTATRSNWTIAYA